MTKMQVCPYCDFAMSALMKECIGCGCKRDEMIEYESL